MMSFDRCSLCPRQCGVDRTTAAGICGCGIRIRIARAALHFWEEPCISGSRGSGTVFFSGCPLRCCYCQNHQVSIGNHGRDISKERLSEIFLELQEKRAHNINLVTATQYMPLVLQSLDKVRSVLHIPVIYNSSGYERTETIKDLNGYIDIYLPDLKYRSSELSWKYSKAKDYFPAASNAVGEMTEQAGRLIYDKDGMLQKGTIIRHLVLPGGKEDSFAILEWLHKDLPPDKYLLSLMSQYTPVKHSDEYPELNRRVTTYEYGLVVRKAVELGLPVGFIQERSSAKKDYTPEFDMEGV